MMSDCVSVPTVPSRDAAAKAFLELQDELLALPSERQRRILRKASIISIRSWRCLPWKDLAQASWDLI